MKRYITIVKNCFSYLISILLGIAIAIAVFVEFDTVPATQLDYKQLEQKAYDLHQNPNLLLETYCTINVNGEIITVKFENNECMITTTYDKNFNIISIYREDKSVSHLYAFNQSFSAGFFIFIFAFLILSLVFFIFECIIKAVLKAIKVHKANN